MPTKKARLQVILADEATDQLKRLADERGLSVSAMCSSLLHAALRLPEFQPKPDLTEIKGLAVKAAIEGADISYFKARKLLELVEHLAGQNIDDDGSPQGTISPSN